MTRRLRNCITFTSEIRSWETGSYWSLWLGIFPTSLLTYWEYCYSWRGAEGISDSWSINADRSAIA